MECFLKFRRIKIRRCFPLKFLISETVLAGARMAEDFVELVAIEHSVLVVVEEIERGSDGCHASHLAGGIGGIGGH